MLVEASRGHTGILIGVCGDGVRGHRIVTRPPSAAGRASRSAVDLNATARAAVSAGQCVAASAVPTSASSASVAASAAPDRRSLLVDIASLLFKVGAFAALFVVLFSFVFGAFRYADVSMAPRIADGDMAIDYRLDKDYAARDAIVFSYDGNRLIGRVVALAGDVVDITADGLEINGSLQQEADIQGATTQVSGGVTFPLTVGEGQVFVLGDNREEALDSRTFGCVDIDRTEGTLVALLRTRGM